MDSLTNFTAKSPAKLNARVTVTEFVLLDLTQIEAIVSVSYRPGSHGQYSLYGQFCGNFLQKNFTNVKTTLFSRGCTDFIALQNYILLTAKDHFKIFEMCLPFKQILGMARNVF